MYRKYERTKQVVEGFKANEEQLKKHVDDYKVGATFFKTLFLRTSGLYKWAPEQTNIFEWSLIK